MLVKFAGPLDAAGRSDTAEIIDDVTRVSFDRTGAAPVIAITRRNLEVLRIAITGNVFVMNDDGHTIDRFITTRTK